MKRLSLLLLAALAASMPATSVAAGFPHPPDGDHRAVRARRLRRYRRPHLRAKADGTIGQAGRGREPRRRRNGGRRLGRRARGARRLHAVHGRQLGARLQSHAPQAAPVRSSQGLRAAGACGFAPLRAGGATLPARPLGGGPDQARQGQAGPSRVRDRGRGLARASLRRILQRRHRHRHHLHSVQRHCAGGDRFPRRSCSQPCSSICRRCCR